MNWALRDGDQGQGSRGTPQSEFKSINKLLIFSATDDTAFNWQARPWSSESLRGESPDSNWGALVDWGWPFFFHRGLRAPVAIGHEGSDFTGEDATGRSIGCCVPGFLTRNSKGDVLYATAKHLLGVNGGVQPEIA
jgi:hypothetical protein